MKRYLLLACLALGSVMVSAQDDVDPTQLMLQQVDNWQARDRPDLARKTLDKLLIVAPDNPDALTRLAQLEIQEHHLKAAQQVLQRLIASHPNHPEIANIRLMLRLLGPERARLQRAHLLAKSGQTRQAVAAYDQLFPNGPPTPDLALEYWRLVSELPGGRQRAIAGLSRLLEKFPGNAKYRLALLELQLAEDPHNKALLAQLIPFTRIPHFERQAASVWRGTLRRLNAEPADIPLYQEYLNYDPTDELIKARLASAQARQLHGYAASRTATNEQAAATSPTTRADPNKRRGLAALDRGRLDAAWRYLSRARKAHPADGEVVGALGLIRLRQGRHGKAARLFSKAQRLDPDNSGKWRSLAQTAHFWGLLKQADAAEAKQDYPQAARLIRQALRIQPDSAYGLATLAHIRVLQQRPSEAEQLYQQALARQADNTTALRGLLDLYIEQARLGDADRLIKGLSRAQRRALGDDLHRLQARLYRAQADQLISKGRLQQATKRLEQALQLTPDDPWLRFALAKLYARQGQAARGIARFEQALARGSNEPDLLYAYALYRASLDQEPQAIALLSRIPPSARSVNMRDNLARLTTNLKLRQARELVDQGDHQAAHALLRALAQTNKDQPWQLLRVADAWSEFGADKQANALLQQLAARAIASGQDKLHQAVILQQARLLRRQQQYAQALALLDAQTFGPALQHDAEDEKVQLYLATGNYLAAAAIYQRRLTQQPDAIDTRFDLARVWIAAGAPERAATFLRDIEPRLQKTDIDGWLALADAWTAIGEPAHARRLRDQLLSEHPDNPELLLRLAEEGDDPDRSLTLLRRAHELLAASSDGAAADQATMSELAQRIARLQAERSLVFSAALDMDDRSSTDGKSSLTGIVLPMELRGPAPKGADWFLRIEPVSYDAGKLDLTDQDEINTFGQGLLCFPACPAAEDDQSARGVAFGIGYQRADLRLDIGTTPIGFLVEDIIGGAQFEGDLGTFSWGVDISRRPMSGTLLTVAGTRDPNSGEVWGGVRASGVTFSLSYDQGGPFGFWSNLGLHYLDGKNVADNRRARLMAGTYWKFINDDDRRLSIGLNTGIWQHDKALDEFTFGHGGYYSPNRYFSLSLPINYYARHGSRLSYRLGGSISQSWSHEDRIAYFPDDPDLQAAAEAQQPTSGVDPYYEGGPGGGFGYSLEAALEYKVDPHLTLGVEANTEQSDFYAPNRATLYLRYSFDKDPRPVRLPPEPLAPYLSF